jgi:two-component system, NarL family, sensor histidine kinase DesK
MYRTGANWKLPRGGVVAGYRSRTGRILGHVFTGVWLLYLVPAVPYLFSHHYSSLYIAGGMAILVVFSVLYVMLVPSWPMSSKHALPGLAALAVLATAACVFYGPTGLVALWIFMSSASGLLVPAPAWAARAVAGCIACYVIFSVTTHAGSSNFLSNLLPVVFIGFAMIGLRRQFQLTAELAKAREEVAQLAASEERLRLARDMHDLTGQSLSIITLKSELAARLLGRLPEGGDRDRARDEVEQVAAVSRQTLRDIREAISGYRRPTLAVEVITARTALASAGIAARDDADLTMLSGAFDPDAEAALAWCLREAVTNVVRHSGAKNCYISITRRAGTMSLTVRDDGRGHVPPAGRDQGQDRARACAVGPAVAGPTAHGAARLSAGTGLHGLSERLSAVGGRLELSPDLHPGFCLIATVPTAPLAPASPAQAAGEVTSSSV